MGLDCISVRGRGAEPTMRYRYYICDVFTDTRFGGNQLAVLPEAEGLSDDLMQKIAREFNFSESTFVLPSEKGHTRKVRIFTPAAEVPFAGHPNVGTAFVLATTGSLGEFDDSLTVTFEEQAGLVPITIQRRAERCRSGVNSAAPEKLVSRERPILCTNDGSCTVARAGGHRYECSSSSSRLGRPPVSFH